MTSGLSISPASQHGHRHQETKDSKTGDTFLMEWMHRPWFNLWMGMGVGPGSKCCQRGKEMRQEEQLQRHKVVPAGNPHWGFCNTKNRSYMTQLYHSWSVHHRETCAFIFTTTLFPRPGNKD